MASCSKDHLELTNGIGRCSVPMWCMGMPSDFCNEPAYGKRPESKEWYNYSAEEYMREDGRYNGYVPGLACPCHGGPRPEEVLNLCDFCDNEIPTCHSDPKFGCGKGNDNVYSCNGYKAKEIKIAVPIGN